MNKRTTIKRKITTMLVVLALVLFVIFGTACTVSLLQMRNGIAIRNGTLGALTSEKSGEMLLNKTIDELMATTDGISNYSDVTFYKAEAQVRVIAAYLESIYNDPAYDNAPQSTIDILTQEAYNTWLTTGVEGNRKPFPHVKAQRETLNSDGKLKPAAQNELNRLSSVVPLLTESLNTNDLIRACFIGTVSDDGTQGFQLSSDNILSQGSVDAAKNFGGAEGVAGRDWYKAGAAVKKGEIAWTKIFVDNSGRGASLTCATPVYDNTGTLRAVVGGSGIVKAYGDVVCGVTIGETGKSFIIDHDANIIITKDTIDFDGNTPLYDNLVKLGDNAIKAAVPKMVSGDRGYVVGEYDGKKVLMAYAPLDAQPWTFVSIVNMEEVLAPSELLSATIIANTKAAIKDLNDDINITLAVIATCMVIVLALILVLSNRFASGLSAPIHKLTEAVSLIGSGNLNTTIDIKSNDETSVLADTFNKMSVDLKSYIYNLASVTAEKERIGAELSVATHIQASMLPCIFPAFPERKEFGIFASMHPAKEVGGDFYDFFLVDQDHLAIVIADVSGKGVPAALFMVIAKTLIKNHAQMGKSVSEVFTEVNAQLCEGNEAGLFVTAWIGILEISTGKFTYSNAGHNAPLLKRKHGQFEYLRDRAGLVLAGMEGIKYKQFETTLEPGDVLFLYTDGVTEATNAQLELLGDDCLHETMKTCLDSSPEQILTCVDDKIKEFVKGEQQFDDITMLCIEIYEK